MAEYHVVCGIAGIYAGIHTQKFNNDLSSDKWRNKSDVTHEALCAVAQHLLFNGQEFRFMHKNQWYVMRIEEFEERSR